MLKALLPLCSLLGVVLAVYSEEEGAVFLNTTGAKSRALASNVSFTAWDNEVNFTDSTQAPLDAALKAYDDYQIEIYPEAIKFPWQNFTDDLIRRQFQFMSFLDEAALPEENRTRLSDILIDMSVIYSSTQIKEYNSANTNATLYLEDVQVKIANSKDPCEKAYYWDGWQTQAGRANKALYQEYVEIENQVAVLNNFSDTAARWQYDYEMDNFEPVLEGLLEDMKPLFRQLHAYMRYQLWLAYGNDSTVIDLEGPIPASLLGNIWGLDGIHIFNQTDPYPNKASIDVTPELERQNYTGLKMAEKAAEFYVSLGFNNFIESFWDYSIFEKPADRDNIDCSDITYNFFNGEDYRVKICAIPTEDDWGRVHHQMAHVVNYMIWNDLPWLFQDAANPAFNQVLNDLIYLFVTGPTHLKNVGLLDSYFVIDTEQEINALYFQALSIVFFLPYAYSLDAWRWKVFRGEITPDNYNCEYWNIRLDAQGVEPPVDRDKSDFDPGAKYHVVNDEQYIMYFISGILQFQLHHALCHTTGQYDPDDCTSNPVYLCDIYNSTAAGEKLKSMISLGKSHPWPDALEKVTGTRTLDAGPLLAYFQPLYEWLVAENTRTGQTAGWTAKNKRCYSKGETKPENGKCRYS